MTTVQPVCRAQAGKHLTFQLSSEVYGIEIQKVQEIIGIMPVTHVPRVPVFVRGVINLRGSVVPVIDLSARFGRARVQPGKKTSIIIYDTRQQGDKQELGVMVDAVAEVIDIPESAMEPAPQFGTTIAREFLRSIGKTGGRFVPVIDTDKALSMDDMAQRVREWQRV